METFGSVRKKVIGRFKKKIVISLMMCTLNLELLESSNEEE
jgi:hypothetical protein